MGLISVFIALLANDSLPKLPVPVILELVIGLYCKVPVDCGIAVLDIGE
jgi:hypothetical protein